MEAAAAFLSVRPRSVAETRRRMAHLGYPAALVEQVLERLGEMQYLDDEAFGRGWLESRDRARPRGESALRRELSLKGLDQALIRSLLDERRDGAVEAAAHDPRRGTDGAADDDEPHESPDLLGARRLIAKRASALAREPDVRKRRARAYALLARNGFSPEICREVASSVADAAPEED
jgi:regulatory protein